MLFKPSARRGGAAYLIALIVSLLMVGMGGAGLAVSVNKLANANRSYNDTLSLYITEGGLADASYWENLDPDTGNKALAAGWYETTAAALDENGRTVANGTAIVTAWKTFNGGDFQITRERADNENLKLTAVGRFPAGSNAAGQFKHKAVVKLQRTPTTTTTTSFSQYYAHAVLSRVGNISIGGGRTAAAPQAFGNTNDKYPAPWVAIDSRGGHPPIGKPGSNLDYNNYWLYIQGYAALGNYSHVGSLAGYVFLNLDKRDYFPQKGTHTVDNPFFGDAFGPKGIITSFGDGAAIQGVGRKGDDGSQYDNDGSGAVEPETGQNPNFDGDANSSEGFTKEVEDRFPDWQLYSVDDYIEQLTNNEFSSLYANGDGTPLGTNVDKTRTMEYRLLQHIGGSSDETRTDVAVASGTFTNDVRNINYVKTQAIASNGNAAILNWASQNSRTNQVYDTDGAGSGTAVTIEMLNSVSQDTLDFTSGTGAVTAPVTLYLDHLDIRKPVSGSTIYKVRVPAGSTIVTTNVTTSQPGLFVSQGAQIEFVETGDTPSTAVNRIYAYDDLKDRTNYAAQFWNDNSNGDEYVRAARETLIVTDGIFRMSDNSAAIRLTNGNLSLYTGAKNGAGGKFYVDNGSLTWYSDNTSRVEKTTPEMSFSGGYGGGAIFTGGDIFIASLGNFRIRNGAQIFAGGGGGGVYGTTAGVANDSSRETTGGKTPTNPNAKMRIFVGHKGDAGVRGNVHLGGIAGAYVNTKLNPLNSTLVAVGPPSDYGVIYFGDGKSYMNLTLFAPDYYVDFNQSGGHNIRGAFITKGFPENQENLFTWDGTNLIKGEFTGVNLTYDLALLDGKAVTPSTSSVTTYKDYKLGGVTVLE